MNKKVFLFLLSIYLILPLFTFAQPGIIAGNLVTVVSNVGLIVLNILWIVAVVVTVVMFVIAGIQFLTAQGEPGKLGTARQSVIWGSAGIVVIILAWSIMTVIRLQIGA